jgi:two-component system, OmpR family, sensor histidine kinase KdpD
MNARRYVAVTRWILAFGALAGIVLFYRTWLHVNPTTVALTLLLYILLLAARWRLQHAVIVSLVATACYNYYFLPPIGTFTIADPQNWLALFAFLSTSVIGSHLSQKARDEAEQARTRQREVEVLFSLSRELLQTDNVAELVNTLPKTIHYVSRADSVILYLLDGDRLYRAGTQYMSGVEVPHFRQLALSLPGPETMPDGEVHIPLKAGVRPRGLLVLTALLLSSETLQAIGGLVSIALDRAQALEDVARSEANKESERLRTLILDSITHELRTPLTSIKGAASALLSTEQMSTEDRRELLTIVDEEADRLNHLVGQAVEMAQIEAHEVHMNFAPIEVADLVERAQESCPWVSSTHPVTVQLPALPKVAADPEMVVKVLCNLLENAAKYSRPQSPIFISAEQKDGFVLTSVADRGIGIDPAEQGLIFDRLYRSRTQSSTPGTGMGLAISRAIIESHHGNLTVTSQPERGSVFTFSLPVA